nr:PREDICTED: cGMP-dependent protein kinase, isozyme 1-like [Bemisia tabaci]XP_018897132.1 PREDICTED: cGMP-dependent protein kinase, isozyme 1-like [Bemisia tabaci]XP_018897133.1 PREDICTED: cGMP-dependent protein kinase, isozyme 1-like [Bemisia tabaci]
MEEPLEKVQAGKNGNPSGKEADIKNASNKTQKCEKQCPPEVKVKSSDSAACSEKRDQPEKANKVESTSGSKENAPAKEQNSHKNEAQKRPDKTTPIIVKTSPPAERNCKRAEEHTGANQCSRKEQNGGKTEDRAGKNQAPAPSEKLVGKCDSGACKASDDKENRVTNSDNKLERPDPPLAHSHSPLRSGPTSSGRPAPPPPTPAPRAHSPHAHNQHHHDPVTGKHACGSLFSSCENEIKTKQLVKCFCNHRNNFEGRPRDCAAGAHEPRPRCEAHDGPRECQRPRECAAGAHEPRSQCPRMQGPAGPHRGCAGPRDLGMGNDAGKYELEEPRAGDGGGPNDDYLRSVILAQEKRLRDLNLKNDEEVMILRKEVTKREYEIIRLRHEIHKLKSVLQQATSFNQDNVLPPIDYDQPNNQGKSGRQGVSGESCQTGKTSNSIHIRRYEKDFRSKQLIKQAIMGNDFLKNLDPGQIREIVDSMYPQKYKRGNFVIRQGDTGAHLFVSAEGEFEIIKDNKILGRMGHGIAFGELAILYNCTRTASIKVIDDAKVWVLDRRVFQQIMMRTGLQRLEDSLQFLKSVPLLQSLSPNILAKIADVLQVEFFPAEHYIIREGAHGDTFYIISNGSVRVTKRIPGTNKEEEVRTLKRGDYFGEQALLKEECRSASVIATAPGVECLSLDRGPFIQLIGGLSELKEKRYEGEIPAKRTEAKDTLDRVELEPEFRNIKIEDLTPISTLGIGGFGRVELVQSKSDKTKVYALKCLKKQHIVDTHQQEHVYNEKHIMMACRNPFICRLYKTFRDSKFVYMLMEPCLGGEVWTILRDRGCFDDNAASFIAACVIEALHYLHSHQIVYRDLKPENLLLDAKGYVKMVDFGFSKRLSYNMKTWTFCGTPEYVAPEVILNKGHDRAVDYWSLGILIFELLSGCPPFKGPDAMKIYNLILEGMDYVSFPRHVSRTAQTLIKRLCHECPAERIGCQRNGLMDVKKHKWFQGFDWFGLQNKTLQPPIIQEVRSPTDTSNFDFYPQDCKEVPDELSNWDIDF